MFELPSMEGVREVVISREVVEGQATPLYIYADQKDEAASAPQLPEFQIWLPRRVMHDRMPVIWARLSHSLKIRWIMPTLTVTVC